MHRTSHPLSRACEYAPEEPSTLLVDVDDAFHLKHGNDDVRKNSRFRKSENFVERFSVCYVFEKKIQSMKETQPMLIKRINALTL